MTLPVNVRLGLFMLLCIAVPLLAFSYDMDVVREVDIIPAANRQADNPAAEPATAAEETSSEMRNEQKEDDSGEPVQSSVVYYDSPHYLIPENDLMAKLRSEKAGNEWMLYLVLICFFILAIAKLYYSGRVSMLIRSVFNLRFFIRTDKHNMILGERVSYLLKLNYLVCLSLLIMQTSLFFEIIPPWMHLHPVLTLALILLAIALFYVLKHLLISYIGWLFHARKAGKAYFSNIFVFNHFVGILLLPLVFYQALNPLVYILIAACVLLVAFNVNKVMRSVILARTYTDFSVYYIFLYLCGVELAPLLMLGKAASVLLFNKPI